MTSVLVVDDDPAVLNLIRAVLRIDGHDVESVLQATEGLEILDQREPDVVVLDLSMPEMDGRQFFREARLRGYSGPVVICSAFGAVAAQRELGAEAALDKPFNPEELLNIVGTLASSSHSNGT